ncbi:MAG: ferritin-like domain-containing protein [Candidatus Thorarchaeota archaeon]
MTSVQQTFEQLVSLAIKREEEAYDFYMKHAKEAEFSSSAKLLEDLAKQEEGHKAKLVAALEEGVCTTFTCDTVEEVEKMDLAQYLVDIPLSPSSGPQDILIVAIKKEAGAESFYKALAELTGSGTHRTIFETMAKEEEGHKNRLQHMYDDIFQPDM